MLHHEEDESLIATLSKDTTRRSILFVVLGWQFVAFILALINVFSELLTEHNWRTPTLMNAPMYLLLFIFTVIRSCIASTNQKINNIPNNIPNNTIQDSLSIKSYHSVNSDMHSNTAEFPYLRRLLCTTDNIPNMYYLLGSIADVEGNVLLLTAYEYTTITSVSLLDCFAIPMVMIWGIFIFGRKYTLYHYIGILISLLGMILLVYTDSIVNKSANHGSNAVLGDILVLCGAVCYSVSNSFAEYVVKQHQSIWKYLRMMGMYGFIITLIQGFVWEYKPLFQSNEYNVETMLYLLGYVTSLSTYYIVIPILLQYSSAVVFNLSLLSADFWAVLAAVFLFSVTLNTLYFIAFVVIICGVVCYNVSNHIYKVHN